MPSNSVIARALAAAFVADRLEVESLVERGAKLLGKRWRWLRPLARRVCVEFAEHWRPGQIAVSDFLQRDPGFTRACSQYELALVIPAVPLSMRPSAIRFSASVPQLGTPGELADWLGINIAELDWFADRRNLESKSHAGPLRHYHYRALTKRSGRIRMVEAPKPRLKELQRRILAEILNSIPPHPAAHGFRRGCSITSFAAPHVGQRVVARLDLEDFFPSIPAARVRALFQTVGYPEPVARLLAGLCTNATPAVAWDEAAELIHDRMLLPARSLYSRPHLPQGAPTSPALANLCAYALDCRLSGLAQSAGALYTRYADDLAFSGSGLFERGVKRFLLHVAAMAVEEGFAVNHHKTRIMRRGTRQRLAGLVVNARVNVRRDDYDRLKAILTNCVRQSPAEQNRAGHPHFRAHLLGRISFFEMIHAERGQRLRELFQRIAW